MFLWCSRIDQYIIYEYNYKLVQVGLKDPVHNVHKRCWGIGESKGHHRIFIVPVLRTKCCPKYVFFLDAKLMVP